MNGHRLRVWVGRDGIMSVSCFCVSIVVSGFSYTCMLHNPCGVCYGAGVGLDFSVDLGSPDF